MIHLFIDTNIFLNFYRFSNDQLHKLEELVNLIKSKKVKLYLTEQVVDEFNRNRENAFKETITHISNFTPKLTIPVMCSDMKEMKSIQKFLKSIAIKKEKILERLKREFRYNNLKIDKIMNEIILSASPFELDNIIYERAIRRFNLGNPPGKNNSYGDAVNWEILLEKVPRRKPLYFIGRDGDFISPLDPEQFSNFLNLEWKKKKGSSVKFYRSILEFLKEKNPKSKITTEEVKKEKETATPMDPSLLANISNISNFMKTNEELMKSSPFMKTNEELMKLSSLLSNNEVLKKFTPFASDVYSSLLNHLQNKGPKTK